MWRVFRVFKPAHCKVDEFRAGRTRQPDDEFLRDCGLGPGTAAADIALAVRRAVAGVGLVDPLFDRRDDSHPGTLDVLPLWDSMDWLAFALELERELGRSVRWQTADIVRRSPSVTVSDLIAHVQGVLEQEGTAEPAR
jgi:hypothetical protein